MNSKNVNNYENVVIRKEQEIGINNFGLEYLVSLEQEIERLNNIINEIEKFIDEEYRYYEKRNYPTFGACMGALNRIKDKLQELKGDDKE